MEGLKESLEGTLSGKGSLAMLVGEPGIGKTRLAEEFGVYAGLRGAQVLTGHCYEGESALPYRPFIEAFRQYTRSRPDAELRAQLGPGAPEIATLVSEIRQRFPDIEEAPKLDPDAERLRLFESVTEFLRNASHAQPLVFHLDDLHWSDKPSLLLLQHLAQRTAHERLLILGAYRDVELERTHPLSEVLGNLRRLPNYRRVLLRGLPQESVVDLLTVIDPSEEGAPARQALAAALFQETEGNPFFIREVLAHLIESGKIVHENGRWVGRVTSVDELGIPEGVREVIGRRLSRMSGDCNRMLTLASLRYDVYVEEMGRYRGVADHDRRGLYEDVDAQSRISYIEMDGDIVATARLTWGGDGALPQRMIDQYSLSPFLAELPATAMAVGERAMVRPHLRGTDLLVKLMCNGMTWVNGNRIQLIFGDCEPHLLNLYLGLGQRTYSKTNINSQEAGYLIPIVTVVEDIDHFRRLNSPLLPYLRDFGPEARIPACIQRAFAEGSAVTSRVHASPADYWGEVHGALSELEANRPGALDGLTEQEAAPCLKKSTIIECQRGDRVLKKGGVARNLFVVLDGTLEVRGGDAVEAVLTPGDVFGEMAFLLERPRSRDVFAATNARILSLSEAQLRTLIASDPAIAAKLLLNISKMLCLRIVRDI